MVAGDFEVIAAVVLGALSAVLLVEWIRQHRRRARVLARLQAIGGSQRPEAQVASRLLRQKEDSTARWMKRISGVTPTLRDMDQLLEQAGLQWRRSTLVAVGAGIGFTLAATATLATGSFLLAPAGLALGMFLPRLYVLRRRAQRVSAFEEQLPEAIDLLSRAIRAGHAVPMGLRAVAEESDEPIATEFRRVFEEQKYGLPFEESMLSLTRRIDLIDLRVMVVAILVQREVGGNLTEILDKISTLIRTRFTLRRQLRVHTAQGRLSGYVLSILPIAVAGVISLFNPEYTATLITDPLGHLILASAAMMLIVGYLWIWRVLKLDL